MHRRLAPTLALVGVCVLAGCNDAPAPAATATSSSAAPAGSVSDQLRRITDAAGSQLVVGLEAERVDRGGRRSTTTTAKVVVGPQSQVWRAVDDGPAERFRDRDLLGAGNDQARLKDLPVARAEQLLDQPCAGVQTVSVWPTPGAATALGRECLELTTPTPSAAPAARSRRTAFLDADPLAAVTDPTDEGQLRVLLSEVPRTTPTGRITRLELRPAAGEASWDFTTVGLPAAQWCDGMGTYRRPLDYASGPQAGLAQVGCLTPSATTPTPPAGRQELDSTEIDVAALAAAVETGAARLDVPVARLGSVVVARAGAGLQVEVQAPGSAPVTLPLR